MELIDVIRDLGFPIAVATFVLVRLNGKMDKLTGALVALSVTMEKYIASEKVEEESSRLRGEAMAATLVQKLLDNQQRILDAVQH